MAKTKQEFLKLEKGLGGVSIGFDDLRSAVLVLRSVNHEIRREIIDLLAKNKMMTVTKLYTTLRIEQSVASQHLATLRNAGIVDAHREGKFIRYELNRERVNMIAKLVDDLAK